MGREYGDLTAPRLEAADHILLDAEVQQSHPQLLPGNGGIDLDFLPAHPFHSTLDPVGSDGLQQVLNRKMLRTGDHTVHGTLTAECAGDSAGVHALYARDTVFF